MIRRKPLVSKGVICFMKQNKQKRPYAIATAFLTVIFFLVGFFTMGSFAHSGEAYYATKDTRAVVQLDLDENQTYVKEIYLNVGAVYAVGAEEEARLTVQTSTSKTSTSDSTWSNLASFSLTQAGLNGENGLFNWVNVAKDMKKGSSVVRRVSIKANVSFDINEIICIADNGKTIPLSVAEYGNEDVDTEELEKVFDAQARFAFKSSAYRNFTQEEGKYLSYLRNLSLGSEYYQEDSYTFAEDFGALGTLLLAPSVALFGESVFALRLPSLLATSATLVGVFLLFSLLFRNEKYGFLASCLFVLGGLAWTAGRLGAPYAFVACALVYATYFAYLFFAKGVSEHNIAKGASKVLLSGLCLAAAVAVEGVAILPALGVFAVLAFGFIRQKKAFEYTVAKLETIEDEDKKKLLLRKQRMLYQNKLRACAGYLTVGSLIGYFFFIFLSTIICHNAYARAFGNLGFALLLGKNIAAGFSVTASVLNGAIAFAWFLPLKAATLYVNGGAEWLAIANPALTVFALASLIASTVALVKNRKATDKKNNRVRRVYSVLLSGTLLTALAAVIKGTNQTTGALAFYVFYYGFILLAAYLYSGDGEEEKKIEDLACVQADEAGKACKCRKLCKALWIAAVAAGVLCFVAAVPALFGFATFSAWTKIISLLTIL